MNCFIRFFVVLVLLIPLAGLADKTDIVILKNGDKITGEVKQLEAGVLAFSTDAMGTVDIEWRYIERIISTGNQSIDTTDGRRFLGKLAAVDDEQTIGVQTETDLIELDAQEVFSVWPVQATFWDKSDFDISFGVDYSKSTEITDLTLSADWSHRKYDRLTEASLRADITRQPQAEDQNSSQLQMIHQYIQPDNKFRSVLGNLESNDSLGLDARIYAGGVLGKYVMRKSDRWLSLSGGLVATQEKFTGGGSQTSLEAVGNISFSLYRFADPERSLSSKLTLFPSITESGRLRSDFRTTFKLEFIENLYWSMEAYFQSDNEPPSSSSSTNDYGITTAIGWSL